jgi:hypothetical protein
MSRNVYERRTVCFLDILGFKEAVRATMHCEEEASVQARHLKRALLAIRDTLDVGRKQVSQSKRVTQFSDSIVISFQANEPSEVFFTLLSIQWVAIRLVYHGLLVRGGVAIGPLCHTHKLLFGPALVDAYELESRRAHVPRILVTGQVVEIGARHSANYHDFATEKEYITDCLQKDEDDRYFVDYFLGASRELDDPLLDFPLYMDQLRKIVNVGLAHPDSGVRGKYEWARRKFNRAARVCRAKSFVASLEDPDVQAAYAGMKDIRRANLDTHVTFRSSR